MRVERDGLAAKRTAALRWFGAGAVALGLHAGVALLLIRDARPEPLDAGGGDAFALELDPVEGRAAKPDDAQPAVPADEASEEAAAAAAARASRAPPPSAAEASPTPPPQTEASPPAPPPVQPPPSEPSPSETVPDLPAPPPPPEPRLDPPPEPPVRAAQPSAASAASAAAEDAAPMAQRLSAARLASWRGKLVPHLNRFRRFPPGIGSGTARVAFTIDGAGRVTDTSIATSSGNAALDAAAQALIQRASPFPAPPPGMERGALSFVVPVHYDARRP